MMETSRRWFGLGEAARGVAFALTLNSIGKEKRNTTFHALTLFLERGFEEFGA